MAGKFSASVTAHQRIRKQLHDLAAARKAGEVPDEIVAQRVAEIFIDYAESVIGAADIADAAADAIGIARDDERPDA